MKANSHYSKQPGHMKARLTLLTMLMVLLTSILTRPVLAEETQTSPIRTATDRPVRAMLALVGSCCADHSTGSSNAVPQQSCTVAVNAQYCHELPPNPPYMPEPVDVCYWVKKTVTGSLNADRGCCEVTLTDADFPGLAGTYCVKGVLVIGPVFNQVAHSSSLSSPSQALPGSNAGSAKARAVLSDPEMITVSYPNGQQALFTAAVPLAITRDMENALIVMPQGATVQFTSDGLHAQFIELRYFDPSAFDYNFLPNGFQLQSKVAFGNAYTTLIVLDGVPFYVRFVFVPAIQ